jgi:hypothetical protein
MARWVVLISLAISLLLAYIITIPALELSLALNASGDLDAILTSTRLWPLMVDRYTYACAEIVADNEKGREVLHKILREKECNAVEKVGYGSMDTVLPLSTTHFDVPMPVKRFVPAVAGSYKVKVYWSGLESNPVTVTVPNP